MIAIISDIHANKSALDAVVNDMPDSVETIICCGDIVGYGPSPKECVETVQNISDITIRGNHDRMILTNRTYNSTTARFGLKFAKKRLHDKHFEWISQLDDSVTLNDIQIYHSHPDPQNLIHVTEDMIVNEFSDYLDSDIFIYGHTHKPVNKVYNDTLVLNPGSVGQPRDGDYRASYILLDIDCQDAEIVRVGYDIDEVIEEIDKKGFPKELKERLREGW